MGLIEKMSIIEYFESILTNFQIPRTQLGLDIEKFSKSNGKLFFQAYQDRKMISVEDFEQKIPKRSNQNKKSILLEAYKKILTYDISKIIELMIEKFVNRNRSHYTIYQKWVDSIFYSLQSLFIIQSPETEIISFYELDIEFNKEQMKFIQQPLSNGKLMGIPGGGKTGVTLGKIYHFLNQKEIEANGFLVLSFSKNSVSDFIEKIKYPSLHDRISTIHSLSGYIMSILSNGMKSTTQSIDTCVHKATELLKLHSLKSYHFFKQVKCIFVDESQDISSIQYQFLLTLSENLISPLIMIGDPNQSIYGFQNGSDRFLRNHEGFMIELFTNYRSSKEIVDLINAASPMKRSIPMKSGRRTMEDGSSLSLELSGFPKSKKPVLFVGNMDEILKDILKEIKIPFHGTIAIVGPVKRSEFKSGKYTNIGLNTVANYLTKHQIAHKICYDDSNYVELSQKIPLIITPGVIHLMTIHGTKGLEFDRVYLLNYHLTTLTKIPASKKEYQELKYLWYVAFSRAKDDLRVYVLDDKYIFPAFKKYSHCFTIYGSPKKSNIKFKPFERIHYHWTDVLSDKKLFSEEILMDLEFLIKFNPISLSMPKPNEKSLTSFEKERMNALLIFERNPLLQEEIRRLYPFQGSKEPTEIKEFDQYSMLYGIWAEQTLVYSYSGICYPLNTLKTMVYHTISIPNEWISDAKLFLKHTHYGILHWTQYENVRVFIHKNSFRRFMDQKRDESSSDICFIFIENEDRYLHIEELKLVIDGYEQKSTLDHRDLFQICLLQYQYHHGKKSLLQMDFEEHLVSLQPYDDRIRQYAKTMEKGYQFQVRMEFSLLPIKGIADAMKDHKILEIKFSKTREPKWNQMLQLLGYAEMFHPRESEQCELELLNLYHMVSYKIQRNKYNRFLFYKTLAKAITEPLQNCCWIYDLETTGCIGMDGVPPKITEIHVEELSTGIIPISTLVKVGNHVYDEEGIFQFNGISRNMCNSHGIEPSDLVKKLKFLISISDCKWIAHNGNQFDHKIIRRYLGKEFPFDTLDTMCLIPLFIDRKLKRKKLTLLYEDILGHPFTGTAHRAQQDVVMMIEIMLSLGITSKLLFTLN